MEIYTCNVDGSDVKKLQTLAKPIGHPSFTLQAKNYFSSNHGSEKGFNFQLYSINTDGTGLEQITSESNFNAFPMFSPDGKINFFIQQK